MFRLPKQPPPFSPGRPHGPTRLPQTRTAPAGLMFRGGGEVLRARGVNLTAGLFCTYLSFGISGSTCHYSLLLTLILFHLPSALASENRSLPPRSPRPPPRRVTQPAAGMGRARWSPSWEPAGRRPLTEPLGDRRGCAGCGVGGGAGCALGSAHQGKPRLVRLIRSAGIIERRRRDRKSLRQI
jgi:hypothetical protein